MTSVHVIPDAPEALSWTGEVRWMPESRDIIRYLEQMYGKEEAA